MTSIENIKLFVLVVLIVNFGQSSAKLPSGVEVCSRNDPNLSQCIINSVKQLQPRLAEGKLDEDYQTPPIEPFTYEDFTIERGADFKVEILNLKMRGGSKFDIEKLKFNFDNKTLEFIIALPKMMINGNYKLKARILLIDLSGNGEIISEFYNSRVRVRMYAEAYEKDGATYLRFKNVNVKIKPGDSKIGLTNLFSGDPTLGQIGNQVVNDNRHLFMDDIVPVIEQQFANIFMKVGNRVIENATVDELFPQ